MSEGLVDILLTFDIDKTLSPNHAISNPIFREVLAKEGGKKAMIEFFGDTSLYGQKFDSVDDMWVNIIDHWRKEKGTKQRNAIHLELLIWLEQQGLVDLSPESLRRYGKDNPYYPGVQDFFYSLHDEFKGKANLHIVALSLGVEEMARGSLLGQLEEQGKLEIIGSRFQYGTRNGRSVIVRADTIEPSMKVDIVSKLMKGKEYHHTDKVSHDKKLIKKGNVVGVTDSKTDASFCAFIRDEGGIVFMVYDTPQMFGKLKEDMAGRYHYLVPADYRKGFELDRHLKNEVYRMITMTGMK
jgi:hypothetical protein